MGNTLTNFLENFLVVQTYTECSLLPINFISEFATSRNVHTTLECWSSTIQKRHKLKQYKSSSRAEGIKYDHSVVKHGIIYRNDNEWFISAWNNMVKSQIYYFEPKKPNTKIYGSIDA